MPRALWLIALCFAAAGLLRIGEASEAVAENPALAGLPAPDAPADPGPGCLPAEGTESLLGAIRDRQAQLDAREASLAEQAKVLEVARAKIEEQIAALDAAEKRLADTLALADKAAEADIARMVAIYEAMKPKDAAKIFATMDVSFAAGFLGRMKPDIAGAVLAGLPAERAYAISAELAGRNANAPTE